MALSWIHKPKLLIRRRKNSRIENDIYNLCQRGEAPTYSRRWRQNTMCARQWDEEVQEPLAHMQVQTWEDPGSNGSGWMALRERRAEDSQSACGDTGPQMASLPPSYPPPEVRRCSPPRSLLITQLRIRETRRKGTDLAPVPGPPE